jgi:hypothetical protein
MMIRGNFTGSSHFNTLSIEDSTSDTHPAVAPEPLTWRKIPPPLVTSAGVVVRCSWYCSDHLTLLGRL